MKFIRGLERLTELGRASAQAGRMLRNGLGLFTATVNIPAQTSGKQSITSVTVTGIKTTDILIGYDFRPTSSSDVGYDVIISADDTVLITGHHDAATTTDPASATLTLLVLRNQFKSGLRRLCKEVDTQKRFTTQLVDSFKTYTVTVDVPAMTSGIQALIDVTVTGITTAEVLIGLDFRPATSSDVTYTARITAANTVQLVCHHDAATTTNPASATLTLVTLRP